MKKLTIIFFALYSTAVCAAATETSKSSTTTASFFSFGKWNSKSATEVRLDNIEALLGNLQKQLDTNTQVIKSQDIESKKQKNDFYEQLNDILAKINQQYTELVQQDEAQTQRSNSLSEKLNQQKTSIVVMNSAISSLEASQVTIDEKLAGLGQQVTKGEIAVGKLNSELSIKLKEADATTNAMVSKVADDAASSLGMVAIGFGSIVLFIAGFILMLRRRIDVSGVNMEQKIRSAKASLEEQALSLDAKLIEVLEKQLLLSQEQKPEPGTEQEAEPDHSLSLKVADEITRMQKNIAQMDPSVKGIKPLTKGLERIRKNFMANGYEIVDLLNKPYNSRMNIDVINYVDDPNLGEDDKIIVKIIRPQVNFNGVLIQRAQVDVAVN